MGKSKKRSVQRAASNEDLTNRVALITGSTSEGMGRSTALLLAQRGADIVLNYGTNPRGPDSLRSYALERAATTDGQAEEAARKVEAAIRDMGRRVILVKADTKDESQVADMVAQAEEELGKVDILVNNAMGQWVMRDYTKIPHEHWKEVLAAGIDGPFLMMKHTVPGMRKRKWGRVIHLGLSGVMRIDNMGGAHDYCLAKAARNWMTTSFGWQEHKHGITVNCIEPWMTDRMTLAGALKAAKGGTSWHKRTSACAHDAAETIAFLCSEAGRFVTGSIIRLV
ncbi:hypothetical protein LCGC14_2522120 [marine sediment metagenome]|uniref:Uncharacterized protein n=1 Tax=marine sediment metagenome TaxID=412755 RepID=A0A0F9BJ20_9ZZZZ